MRYIPKLLGIPVLIGLASAGVMVTSTLTAAARTAADTQPPTPPYISAIFPLGGCKVDMRIGLSTDNRTPQSRIRYQVLSNGVPIPGGVAGRTRVSPPGFGHLDVFVVPAPTAQRFTLEAVERPVTTRHRASPSAERYPGPAELAAASRAALAARGAVPRHHDPLRQRAAGDQCSLRNDPHRLAAPALVPPVELDPARGEQQVAVAGHSGQRAALVDTGDERQQENGDAIRVAFHDRYAMPSLSEELSRTDEPALDRSPEKA